MLRRRFLVLGGILHIAGTICILSGLAYGYWSGWHNAMMVAVICVAGQVLAGLGALLARPPLERDIAVALRATQVSRWGGLALVLLSVGLLEWQKFWPDRVLALDAVGAGVVGSLLGTALLFWSRIKYERMLKVYRSKAGR